MNWFQDLVESITHQAELAETKYKLGQSDAIVERLENQLREAQAEVAAIASTSKKELAKAGAVERRNLADVTKIKMERDRINRLYEDARRGQADSDAQVVSIAKRAEKAEAELKRLATPASIKRPPQGGKKKT